MKACFHHSGGYKDATSQGMADLRFGTGPGIQLRYTRLHRDDIALNPSVISVSSVVQATTFTVTVSRLLGI